MNKIKIEIDTKFMLESKNGRLLAESINLYFGEDKIILNFESKPPYDFTKELFYSLWQSHSIDVIKDKIVIYDRSIQGLIEVIGIEFNKNVTTKGV